MRTDIAKNRHLYGSLKTRVDQIEKRIKEIGQSCPHPFIQNKNSCYHVVLASMNWTEAGRMCQLSYAANLLTIDSKGEQRFISRVLKQNYEYVRNGFYTSGKSFDTGSDNQGGITWKWSTQAKLMTFKHLCKKREKNNSADRMDSDSCSLFSTASGFSHSKALVKAAEKSKYDSVEKLLKKGADLFAVDENGKTALHYAVINKQLDLVKLLLKHRASVDVADMTGKTPLHYAVIKCFLDSLKLMLLENPVLDWPDHPTRKTPLHYAVGKGDANATSLLLFHGADLSLKTKDRDTVFDICRNRELFRILTESRLLSDGVKLGGVTIESKKIREGKTTHFNSGLKIKYRNKSVRDAFPLTVRRHKGEFATANITLDDLEDTMSDYFVCRLGKSREKTIVTLSVPIFNKIETTQDNILKTDTGQEFDVEKCSFTDEDILVKFSMGPVFVDDLFRRSITEARRRGHETEISSFHASLFALGTEERSRGDRTFRIQPKQIWMGSLRVDLTQCGTFVIISRPKKEVFALENVNEASTVTSTVDDRVELDIPSNTFDAPTKICMEILDKANSCKDADVPGGSTSITSFYTLNAEGSDGSSGSCVFSREINMKLPVPESFQSDGDVIIFSRANFTDGELDSDDSDDSDEGADEDADDDGDVEAEMADTKSENGAVQYEISNEEDENAGAMQSDKKWSKWQILGTDVNIEMGRMSFSLSSFSIKVAMNLKRDKKVSASRWDFLKQHVHKMYRKSRQRERTVVFMALAKASDARHTYTVVIESTQPETANERLEYWKGEGFQENNPVFTAEYTAVARQTFVVGISDNLRTLCNLQEQEIVFHPKRQNFQCIAVALKEETEERIGCITIGNKPKTQTGEDKLRQSIGMNTKMCNKLLTTIVIHFPPPKPKEDYLEFTSDSDPEDEEAIERFEGFTDNSFLSTLNNELKDNWLEIGMLTGSHYRRLEKVMDDDTMDEAQKKAFFLRSWRNKNIFRPHLGLPTLISAISTVGRPDLNIMLKVMLKGWCASNTEGPFYDWLQKAFSDPDVMTPEEYPRPMSEPFLMTLLDYLGDQYKLVTYLDVTDEEIEAVKDDKTIETRRHKLLKLLVTGRRNSKNRVVAMSKLIHGLIALNNLAAKNWAIMVARQWCEKNKRRNDDFAEQLREYLHNL
ncbi:hypothetical protein ScPMuIL_005569 [Solemya velum]